MKAKGGGVLLAGVLLAMSAASWAGAGHEHHGHEQKAGALRLDQGRKWQTDEPLRRTMGELRGQFAGKLHAIHAGRLGRDEQAALAGAVQKGVATIVEQCRLPPDADAMLHVVIADLLAAAEGMQAEAQGQRAAAAKRAVAALDDYGRHFEHPGWRALE